MMSIIKQTYKLKFITTINIQKGVTGFEPASSGMFDVLPIRLNSHNNSSQ